MLHERGSGWIQQMILPCLWGRNESSSGLTRNELLIVLMVMASLGIPLYAKTLENARITKAIADIRLLEREILVFQRLNGTFPNNLNQIGRGTLLDPYGNPYQYLNIATAGNRKGQFRKDKNLAPINDDFDLYSMGSDGQSAPPLTAKQSWDDIVRASDGGYVGIASEY